MNKKNTTLLVGIVIALGIGLYNQYQSKQSVQTPNDTTIPNNVPTADPSSGIVIATWNVRGYPEKRAEDGAWFTNTLSKLNPDIVCIQEIANQDRIDTFASSEVGYSLAAFEDSSDGQDNAIFATVSVDMLDIPDPTGFQHPVQAAYVARDGFDAVIVTVHLSWTDTTLREQEKAALKGVVTQMLMRDPDLIINGDFNTTEQGIQELADGIGMVVMVPAGQDGVGTTHANNRYDHFLVSPDLANEEAVSCRIETFAGEDLIIAKRVSDHLPVVATFSTSNQFRDRN